MDVGEGLLSQEPFGSGRLAWMKSRTIFTIGSIVFLHMYGNTLFSSYLENLKITKVLGKVWLIHSVKHNIQLCSVSFLF